MKSNKATAIVRLVIWAVVAVLLTGVLALVLLFDGVLNILDSGINIDFGGLPIFGGYVYDDPDSYSIGEKIYTEQINDISIDWVDGDVSFIVWDGDGVKLDEQGEGTDPDNRMRSRVENGKLSVKFKKSGRRWIKSAVSKKLTVYIPEKLAMELGRIEVNSVSSGVKFINASDAMDIKFSCDSLSVACVSGNVTVYGMDARRVEIEGVSSYISYNGKAGELDVSGVSGALTFMGEMGKLDVEAVSDEVTLKLDSVPTDVDIQTVSGDIDITLPAGAGFTATLDSASGDMRVDGKDCGHYYTTGDRSAELDFETISGNVNICFE